MDAYTCIYKIMVAWIYGEKLFFYDSILDVIKINYLECVVYSLLLLLTLFTKTL